MISSVYDWHRSFFSINFFFFTFHLNVILGWGSTVPIAETGDTQSDRDSSASETVTGRSVYQSVNYLVSQPINGPFYYSIRDSQNKKRNKVKKREINRLEYRRV